MPWTFCMATAQYPDVFDTISSEVPSLDVDVIFKPKVKHLNADVSAVPDV